MKVSKRNKDVVDFNEEKIKSAVNKAKARTDDDIPDLNEKVVRYVKKHINKDATVDVDTIHRLVENGIMNSKAFDTAREYVTYRKQHEPDIFRERTNYKPFEYPQLKGYMDAIHQSFWVVDEFSFTSDIQEYQVELNEHQRQVIQRTMLAISQIEARFVKTFWGKLYDRIPKPEVADVGATFSDSECHVEGTEILTPTGWKDFKEINVGDDVIQFNPEDDVSSLATVKHVVNEQYSGKIHSVDCDTHSFKVTPNHRMIYRDSETGNTVERVMGDIEEFTNDMLIPVGCEFVEETETTWEAINTTPTVEDYEGTIHCVTVDSGFIITRYNDKVLISGNSRHATSYSQLLEYLGMNEIFERLEDFDCLRKRQEYLKSFVSPKDNSNKEFTKSILMFSMFVENVSLFGQFLIMSSFDKYDNKLTGISNVVQSTSADESVHALFGAELINIIREENPDWFDDDFVKETHDACRVSMEAESEIVDWIFESGDLEYITAEDIKDYLRWRFNQSMEMINYPPVFDVRDSTKEKFQWFEMQVNSTTNPDFFARRNINYTKVNKSFDQDELF